MRAILTICAVLVAIGVGRLAAQVDPEEMRSYAERQYSSCLLERGWEFVQYNEPIDVVVHQSELLCRLERRHLVYAYEDLGMTEEEVERQLNEYLAVEADRLFVLLFNTRYNLPSMPERQELGLG